MIYQSHNASVLDERYIYRSIDHKNQLNVGKYTVRPMDPLGMLSSLVFWRFAVLYSKYPRMWHSLNFANKKLPKYMSQLEVQSLDSGVKVWSRKILNAVDVFVQKLLFSYLKIPLSYQKSQDASGLFSHHQHKAYMDAIFWIPPSSLPLRLLESIIYDQGSFVPWLRFVSFFRFVDFFFTRGFRVVKFVRFFSRPLRAKEWSSWSFYGP